MHRLTNADADRLARDLDAAAVICHSRAAECDHIAAAAEAMGSVGLAVGYGASAASARGAAQRLDDYAGRLCRREALWDRQTRLESARLTREGHRLIAEAKERA